MIKELKLFGKVIQVPGWLNWILLFCAYCLLAYGFLHFIHFIERLWSPFFGEYTRDAIDLVLAFCGAYLAKWRFYDGSLHFN